MRRTVITTLLLLANAICYAANSPVAVSIHSTVGQIKMSVAGALIASGYQITSENGYQLIATKELQGMQAAFTSALIGGDAFNKPVQTITLSFAPSGTEVGVVARGDIVSQGSFGRVNRVPMDNKKQRAELQNFLAAVKAEVEKEKPPKSYLGIFYVSKDSPELKAIAKDSPAEKAGLLKGDMLVAVAGTPTKSAAAISEELDKYEAGTPLKLSVLREGKLSDVDVVLAAPRR